jgi:hypothetical protein
MKNNSWGTPAYQKWLIRIGEQHGALTIVDVLRKRDKNNNIMLLCKCDICGKINAKIAHTLDNNEYKSCGCARKTDVKSYIGKTYGMLTVLADRGSINGKTHVLAKCSCGGTRIAKLTSIVVGDIKSCGCIYHDLNGLTAGSTKKAYHVWHKMMSRCYRSGSYKTDESHLKFLTRRKIDGSYNNYGARGITVCSDWHDPKVFVKWYMSNIKPGESMDRIDNNGNYEPSNVRSANRITQNNNMRRYPVGVTGYSGVCKSRSGFEWCVEYNRSKKRISGYKTPLEGMLDRQIYVILNDLPKHLNSIKESHVVSIEVDPKDVKLWKILITFPDGKRVYSRQHKYNKEHKTKMVNIVKSLE